MYETPNQTCLSAFLPFCLSAFVFSFCIVACSKVNEIEKLPINIGFRSSVDPTVYQGMLYFTDFTHLEDYYHHLDTIVANDNVFDIDSMLSLYESQFDYISLREELYEDSFEDADTARAQTFCVVDEIRQSILNNDYCLRVGDSIYFKISTNQIYEISIDSSALISKFINANKGIEDTIPYMIISNGSRLISPNSVLKFSDPDSIYNPPIVPRSPPFELIVAYAPVQCDPLCLRYTLRIKDNGAIFNVYQNADFEIDFGDGTGDSKNFVDPGSFLHCYAEDGTYEVVFKGVLHWFENNVETDYYFEETYSIEVDENCSRIGALHPPDVWKSSGSNALRSRIWFENDIFGQHLGCRTNSFRKIGDEWKKRDATYILAILDGDWRNIATCEFDDNVYKTKAKYNARDCRVSEKIAGKCNNDALSINYYSCVGLLNYDVRSQHTVAFSPSSGSSISKELFLIPCN